MCINNYLRHSTLVFLLLAANYAQAKIITIEPPEAADAARAINKQAAPKSEPSREQLLVKRALTAAPNSREAGLAQLELGLRMLDGIQGSTQNVAAALKWFVLAANQADARIASLGALGAGTTLILHSDSPTQLREARAWLQRARNAGLARADYVEALALWRRGQGKRFGTLDDLLASAARAGDAYALNMQGALFEREGKTDPAQVLYALAASKGSPAAAANMERLKTQSLFAQYVADQSKFTALSLPVNASLHEVMDDKKRINLSGELAYEFARRYHAGRGVQADYLHAVSLYERSAAQRYEPARKMLALIFSRRDKRGGLDIAWLKTLAQIDPLLTSSGKLNTESEYSAVDNRPLSDLLTQLK
jgi:TPR repeat protein